MIETIATIELPIDEQLILQKNRLEPAEKTGREKRISLVTGIHGDELLGMYVLYEVQRRIQKEPQKLTGILDIYPAINPLGIDSINRGLPQFDIDMNHIFPGSTEGNMTEYMAAKLMDDLIGSDLCIDVHASDIFLKEIVQVRMQPRDEEKLMPYAMQVNADLVWIAASATVKEATLAYSLNMFGIPTLAIEAGSGMRIDKAYGDQIVEGILHVMKQEGLWQGDTGLVRKPDIAYADNVAYANAEASGVFMPAVDIGEYIRKGQHIGEIVDALTGTVQETINAPCDGKIITVRQYPIVYHGALMYRILKDKSI